MTLKVIEIFESIQGESSFAGLPTVFVRLAGCNLDCIWCDTLLARTNAGQIMTIEQILETIRSTRLKHVCITGGEPLFQAETIPLLVRISDEIGLTVSLETNGSLSIENVPSAVHCIVDVKCPSSGMIKHNLLDQLSKLRSHDEVKFVIMNNEDYQFARSVYNQFLTRFPGPVFVSPVNGELDPSELAKWVLSDRIPLRVHLQLHKILNIK